MNAAHPTVVVVGGGPAGLMAADVLARGGARVVLYERMPSPGRKLLLAGRGGLNLTHSEPLMHLLGRYGAARAHLMRAIEAFPPSALRAWCESLGQPTYVGSSGRVFPRAMKASPLLRAWLTHLDAAGVQFNLRHCWQGWDDAGRLVFSAPEGCVTAAADAVVLALGGATWPRLGSDGGWVNPIAKAGIEVAPLRPANCGFLVGWSAVFRTRFAGQPLKRLRLSFDGESERGEAVITGTGIEGGGVYALSARLREALAEKREAILLIDLRPDIPQSALEQRLAARRGRQSLATFLRKAGRLTPVEIGLLHEAMLGTGRSLSELAPAELAALVKSAPIRLEGPADIARAISTAGGVAFTEIDETFMLRRKSGVFVAGEMLDWEAPTGGYLLQAAFATGKAAAEGALEFCRQRSGGDR